MLAARRGPACHPRRAGFTLPGRVDGAGATCVPAGRLPPHGQAPRPSLARRPRHAERARSQRQRGRVLRLPRPLRRDWARNSRGQGAAAPFRLRMTPPAASMRAAPAPGQLELENTTAPDSDVGVGRAGSTGHWRGPSESLRTLARARCLWGFQSSSLDSTSEDSDSGFCKSLALGTASSRTSSFSRKASSTCIRG